MTHVLDILKERGFLAQMTFPEELYEKRMQAKRLKKEKIKNNN